MPLPQFFRPAERKISNAMLTAFWARGQKQKGRVLLTGKKRRAMVVSPGALGTIRLFFNEKEARAYVELTRTIEKKVNAAKPAHFEFHPMQFFSAIGPALLERVYKAPPLYCIVNPGETKKSRYWGAFVKRVQTRGISWDKIEPQLQADAKIARGEILTIAQTALTRKEREMWDKNSINIIVLDYDPVARKFLFALTDAKAHD